MGEVGSCSSKSTELQLRRVSKSRDLTYSMMTVHMTVLHMGNVLRE